MDLSRSVSGSVSRSVNGSFGGSVSGSVRRRLVVISLITQAKGISIHRAKHCFIYAKSNLYLDSSYNFTHIQRARYNPPTKQGNINKPAQD